MKQLLLLFLLCLLGSSPTLAFQDTEKNETDSASQKKATKELPLEPERTVEFSTNQGTWISLDVHPNGNELVFDLMGDIYSLPIAGGKATRLTEGLAYDVHPKYSPDGKSLVYISDKSGSDNIWTMDIESKETTQLTKDKNQKFFSAEWTPDGQYLVGARGRRTLKLHLYHKDGGSGAQLFSEPKALKTIDPAFGDDANLVYFSARRGGWNYNARLPQYQVMAYDRTNGEMHQVASLIKFSDRPTK